MTVLDKDKNKCCGCTACVFICSRKCIEMKSDEEGFSYPYTDKDRCSQCNSCIDVCPVDKYPEIKTVQHAYLVQHKDYEILKESTSGGAFTAIAQVVLDKGGVVFGAAFDEKFRVVHISTRLHDELWRFRNSKYVQSDLGTCFSDVKKLLEDDLYVCFSGTPCQVEGLKSYLQNDYNNLLLVDFVCHAVPSPLLWEKYKEYRQKNSCNIENIAFRNKDLYGYTYSQVKIQTIKGAEYYGIETDPYMRAFFTDICDRPCCYNCRFKKRYRISDITIWDCLDVRKFNKKLDNRKGVTRVLTHTNKGIEIVNKIKFFCRIIEILPDNAVEGVNEMMHSVSLKSDRANFFIDLIDMPIEEVFSKYFPVNTRVKIERLIRRASAKLKIYSTIKKIANNLSRNIMR